MREYSRAVILKVLFLRIGYFYIDKMQNLNDSMNSN